MLVTFKSPAAAKIIMSGDLANQLLGIMGKQVGARGVIYHTEMAEAITKLENAVSSDKTHHDEHDAQYPHGAEDPRHETPLRLAQRAHPLLDMMRKALQQEADILWIV